MDDIKDEIGIGTRYNAVWGELQRLRKDTLGYSHIAHDGTLNVPSSPELTALQGKIADRESRLAAADAAIVAIQNALGSYTSLRALKEAHTMHANTIKSAPFSAWELFRMGKDLAWEKGQHITAMPSEMPALLDGYQTQEDALKAGVVTAQAAIIPLAAALATISAKTGIARDVLGE